MRTIKLIIRIIITIIFAPILFPFFVLGSSILGFMICFGLFFCLLYPLGWILDNKNMKEQGLEGVEYVYMPFLASYMFWHYFIKGDNPSKAFEM